MNVALIGASNKPERYAYKALKLLLEKGHSVYPVHPRLQEIEGVLVYQTIRDISEKIHTITLYLGASHSNVMLEDILSVCPERIIFNPGTENALLQEAASHKGIQTVQGCTLVMLKTGQF